MLIFNCQTQAKQILDSRAGNGRAELLLLLLLRGERVGTGTAIVARDCEEVRERQNKRKRGKESGKERERDDNVAAIARQRHVCT